MSFRIDALQVNSFRGIQHINLPIEGQNLIIAGENGSGKSSIVDAIEYFFTGRIKQLEGRSDIDKKQCIPNLRGGSPEVRVAFKGFPSDEAVSVGYPRGKPQIPSSLQGFFELAARQTFVLRRYQVLAFINARDAERYQHISQLIGLGTLDTIEDRWRKELSKAQGYVEELQRDQQGVFDRLSEQLGQPVQTQEELVSAINTQLATQEPDPIDSRKALRQRLQDLRLRSRSEAEISEVERLKFLQDRIERTKREINGLLDESRKFQEDVKTFWRQSAALEDASLELLLNEGYRILRDKADMSNCPLCEAPITDYAALIQRLGERVANLGELTQSRRRVSERKARMIETLTALDDPAPSPEDLSRYGMTCYSILRQRALEEIFSFRRMLEQLDTNGEMERKWQWGSAVTQFQQALPEIVHEVSEQIQQLTLTESEASQLDLLILMTRVDDQWQQLQDAEKALQKARYVSQQINLVHTELVRARKRGLAALLQELEEDFRHFYLQLHPEEGYGDITIPVQRKRRSSVALRAKYHGHEAVHPLNFFSEGHLDSLGLCIFLAFIKRFDGDLRLIVLDDVLTTIDAGHRLRVARLLAQEFPGYQFVVTTHDHLWAKELERVFSNTRLVLLKRWSMDQGADCWEYPLSDWEYYEEQAKNGRPQDAIAGTGRNLEKFLCRMRGNLGLAVPAKPDDLYTIGDLYPDFWKWVRQHPIDRPDRPDFPQELQSLQKELDEVWRLRNWSGAHFNEWAQTVTPEESLSFLNAVKRLVGAFECPVCKSLVFYNRSAKALMCPRCKPEPPPSVVWQYKHEWYARATKLMEARKPKVRANTAPMVQSNFRGFLHDARHRLGISVSAQPYDRYDVQHLYEPFFDWATSNPNPGVDQWEHTIQECKRTLDAYRRNDQWIDIPDEEVETFVETIHKLTSLFKCIDCSQLLNYDAEQGVYFCSKCDKQETTPSRLSAYWFVRE